MKAIVAGFGLLFISFVLSAGCVFGVPQSGLERSEDIAGVQIFVGIGTAIVAGCGLAAIMKGIDF